MNQQRPKPPTPEELRRIRKFVDQRERLAVRLEAIAAELRRIRRPGQTQRP